MQKHADGGNVIPWKRYGALDVVTLTLFEYLAPDMEFQGLITERFG